MRQYLGNETQVRLQRKADEWSDWLYDTKGACHPGRFLGTDDAKTLGWDIIKRHLREDRVFGFRMVAVDDVEALSDKLDDLGFRIDFWDVFSGSADQILAAIEPLVKLALPEGLHMVEAAGLKDAETVRHIQECMLRNGVAPFSGKLLSGSSIPCCTVAVRNDHGSIVAVAYGYFPYNRHSPHRMTAWGGLVSVDKSQRGKGLGNLVNALMLRGCITNLGAEQVQEFVSAGNTPSRRMVEHCGLQQDPSVKCGIATSAGERFTS